MLLAVDIGNTNISFGLFKAGKLKKRFSIPTQGYSFGRLKAHFTGPRPKRSVICSVVPGIDPLINRDLRALTAARPYNIGKQIKVPIKNLYRNPRQVGQDRLVNAYAGTLLFGAPLIVVDFGTAITFDVISAKSEYLGGMILPGLNLSLKALNENTALLPRVKLTRPKEFIGKDTQSSILSGIVYGFASMSDDLIKRIKARIGKNAKVIVTGGDSAILNKYCQRIDHFDPDLTLKGIYLLYNSLVD